jgi:chromosome segregation ATPase
MKFIESYKALKFANHTLTTEAQQQADRLANLNNRAKQSACTNTLLESNIRRLQDAKKHDALANLVQTKDLQTAAEDAKAKAANLSTILQEENKNHGVTQARLVDAQKEIETQKCEGEKAVRDIHFLNENLRTLESTIENLEDKTSTLDRENKKLGSRVGELVKQNTTLTSEVARLKAAEVPVGIHIENMGLKKRVAALEGENTELKGKFEEFGRLIRGCGV